MPLKPKKDAEAEAVTAELKHAQLQKATSDYKQRLERQQRMKHKLKREEQRREQEDEEDWRAESARLENAARAARAAAAKRVRERLRTHKERGSVGVCENNQLEEDPGKDLELHRKQKGQLAAAMELAMEHLRQQAAPCELA